MAKKIVKRALKRTSPKQKKVFSGKWHAVPLKSSFMLASIIGFFISTYWLYPQSTNYGITFMILFTAMFIASLISMTKAPVIKEKY